MLNTREKLIELIRYGRQRAENICNENSDCQSCIITDPNGNCKYGCIADHLIANGVTVQEWIPVTERLPEIVKTERAWRNVYRKSGRVLCACLQADGKRMVKEGYMEFFNDFPEPNWIIPGTIHSVTHWMPLPEPPKGE